MTIKIEGGTSTGGGGGITFDVGTPLNTTGLIRTGPTTIGIGETITSFTATVTATSGLKPAGVNTILESGDQVTSIKYDWTYSSAIDPTAQTISLLSAVNITGAPNPGLIAPNTLRTKTSSPLTMNITAAPTSTTTVATFHLASTFVSGPPASANTTVKYENRRYFGVFNAGTIITTGAAAFAAFSASAEFCTGTPVTKIFDCSSGTPPNRMYICWPDSFPAPASVVVGGFSISDYTINVSPLTNASGFTENYKILVVPNDGGGNSSAGITVQLT